MKQTWKDFYSDAKVKASRRQELNDIKSMKRKAEKERKKALKKAPPVTYAIGSEAIHKHHIPDFQAMWKSKPANIYETKRKTVS